MKSKVIQLIVLSLLITSSMSSQTKGALKEAQTAFRSYKPVAAQEILMSLWNDPKTPSNDKIRAGRYLSEIYSKFFNDPKKAKEFIEQTILLDPKNSSLQLTSSEAAARAKLMKAAVIKAELAITYAKTKSQKIATYSYYGELLLTSIFEQVKKGSLVKDFASYQLDKVKLVNTVKQLERVLKEAPNKREILKTKFALEILAGSGVRALNSWKEYFNYSDDSNSLLKSTFKELNQSLSGWQGNELSIEKRKSIAKALANARNFNLSMVFIKTLPKEKIFTDHRLIEIVNYTKFLTDITALTHSHYRETALGNSDAKKFRQNMIANVKTLWESFTWKNTPKEFSLDNVEIEIDKRFGAAIRIGNPNGWFSITWGHKVIEYSSTIEQYGKKAQMTFRSLDYLISNGFMSWYFNNVGNIGGWQSDSLVYQIRPKYLSGPIEAWKNISNPITVTKREVEIEKALKKDVMLAEKEETILFPGMQKMMLLRSQKDLLISLTKAGYTGKNLRQKFMNTYEQLTFENEILHHEGRHLIDRKVEKELGVDYTQRELEYRAKLSEVALSKHPFLSLASIFKGGIDNSAHGQANGYLAKGLYKWMDKNWKQVKGINPKLPKRIQLYKLTDKQLVSAILSLDTLDD